MAKKKAKPFEGTVQSVRLFGYDAETSHSCEFKIKPTAGGQIKSFVLDPFKSYERYRAFLGLLINAYLSRSPISIDYITHGADFAVRITVVQDMPEEQAQSPEDSPKARIPSINGYLVTSLQAGTANTRSGFKLSNGKEFVLDSIRAPNLAAAMLQLVAAAFSAMAPLGVETVEQGVLEPQLVQAVFIRQP